MRQSMLLLTATAFAMIVASAAEARPALGSAGHRVGGEAAASTKAADGASLIEMVAGFLGFSANAKATPIVGSDKPRSAQPRIEQCEEEKKRAETAKAADSQRTAESAKTPQRGSEPIYLAF